MSGRQTILVCAVLCTAVACGRPADEASPPEQTEAPVPSVTVEESEPGTVADAPEVEEIAPHTMHPALGRNQAFMIDFTRQYIGEGWYIANHDVPDSQWKNDFRASAVTFTPDGMNITIDKKPNPEPGQWPYNSGEVSPYERFHYGYYEVEMKVAKGSGLVSAMFTYTGQFFGTPHDEVDIEFVGTHTNYVEFNVFRNGRSYGSKRHRLPFDASEDFHIYAFDWQPEYVHWYVNGEKVHALEKPSQIPRLPSKIMMNMWAGNLEEWHGPATFEPGTKAVFRCISFSPDKTRTHTCSEGIKTVESVATADEPLREHIDP